MKKNSKIMVRKTIDAEGLMTFGELENGLKTMDFTCLTDVIMEESAAKYKVRAMRDGNVYMTQIPHRFRNTPIFREDNSSLSLGKDGRYYFYFSLSEQLVDELPQQLVRQANAIAQKVLSDLEVSVKRIKKGYEN